MMETMAIFRREVVARRHHLMVAVAFLVVAVLMPLVPGTGPYDAAEVRSLTAQVLALILGYGVAAGLGISVFGRDLKSGRLGFFFARPVSARSIWIGRMLAAYLIALACEAVVVIPAVVAEGAHLLQINAAGWGAILVAYTLVPALLLFLSHALSMMDRARSGWLFVDLGGLAAVAVGSWLALRPLIEMSAVRAVIVVGGLVVVGFIAALACAGLVGLAVGRTDARRTHGALSISLWILLAAVVTGASLASGWLRDFGPGDMDDVSVFAVAPDGDWIEVSGSAPWRLDVRHRFLVSTTGDSRLALPTSNLKYQGGVTFSADGGRAIGLESGSGSSAASTLWWADLEAAAPEIVETTLVVPPRTVPSVAPDGSRVAILEDGTLAVYDLESEKMVTALRLPAPYRKATVVFHELDTLLLMARSGDSGGSTILIAKADLASREVAQTGRIGGVSEYAWLALNADARFLVLGTKEERASGPRLALHDAATGTVIREISDRGFFRFLGDDRLVALSGRGNDSQLIVESVDGLTRVVHPVGAADWEGLGGEALPGQMVFGFLDDLNDRSQGRSYQLIDVDSGESRPIASGLRRHHHPYPWLWGGSVNVHWNISSPAANRIFTDRDGAVVRWDPETGDMVHIVGGSH